MSRIVRLDYTWDPKHRNVVRKNNAHCSMVQICAILGSNIGGAVIAAENQSNLEVDYRVLSRSHP